MKQLLKALKRRAFLLIAPAMNDAIRASEEERLRSLPFRNNPVNLKIAPPAKIIGSERMTIGDNVTLGQYAQLVAMTQYPGDWLKDANPDLEQQVFEPELVIGNNVTSNRMLHIYIQAKVTIGDDVSFGQNVFINDASHGISQMGVAYQYQPLDNIRPITIERGCWIGGNVVVMPGVTIGEYSIIGANSVVTKSIPPHSIAFGAPARVRKVRDGESGEWIGVDGKSS